MKPRNAMQLKALLNGYAVRHGLVPQNVLQNYCLQRFMERVAVSNYRRCIIVKGGILMSAMFGLTHRTTMDIDATVSGLPMQSGPLADMVREICDIAIDDGMSFHVENVSEIADHNDYPGMRIALVAVFSSIRTRLAIDFTTGDSLTPGAVESDMPLLFEDRSIRILSYNLETMLAEKLQTILSRGALNTRARDFYDIFLAVREKEGEISPTILSAAIRATFATRNTPELLARSKGILKEIRSSAAMEQRWQNYRERFDYARNIEFCETMNAVSSLLEMLSGNEATNQT